MLLVDNIRQEENSNGLFIEDKLQILIDQYVKGDKRDHSYFHELTHAMLKNLGYDELNDDEKFVDAFSNVLLQVMQQILKANGVK
jgi:hypothetical protein